MRLQRIRRHSGPSLGWESEARLASPPYHAVTDGKVALCGVPLGSVTDIPWTDYLDVPAKLCRECMRLASE